MCFHKWEISTNPYCSFISAANSSAACTLQSNINEDSYNFTQSSTHEQSSGNQPRLLKLHFEHTVIVYFVKCEEVCQLHTTIFRSCISSTKDWLQLVEVAWVELHNLLINLGFPLYSPIVFNIQQKKNAETIYIHTSLHEGQLFSGFSQEESNHYHRVFTNIHGSNVGKGSLVYNSAFESVAQHMNFKRLSRTKNCNSPYESLQMHLNTFTRREVTAPHPMSSTCISTHPSIWDQKCSNFNTVLGRRS